MSLYVRLMRKEDVAQVNEIDREAFPTQWPPANYQNELRNHMAHITVVCDANKPFHPQPVEPEIKVTLEPNSSSLVSRLRHFFGLGRSSADEGPPPPAHYIVGFVSSWIMADEAHITSIAVREGYRRQGIGETLIISAVETALEHKASMVTLEVRVSNTNAQALYLKYGFTQVGLRKAYYTDNREDALIMTTDKLDSATFQARFQQLKEAHSRRYTKTER